MTVVWIVCDVVDFNATSRRYTPQIVSSGKNLNSASKVKPDYSRYSEISLFITGKLLAFFIKNSNC